MHPKLLYRSISNQQSILQATATLRLTLVMLLRFAGRTFGAASGNQQQQPTGKAADAVAASCNL